MDHTYSSSPWLIPKDCPALVALFRDKGRPVSFPTRKNFNFGEEPYCYLVEKGILATFANRTGQDDRLMSIFQPGTVLGAAKSLKQRFNRKPLIARALVPVEALRLDASQFRRALDADPQFACKALLSFLAHDDAKIEGLIMNDLLTVQQRLAHMVHVLFLATGRRLSATPARLPPSITVTELARLVHSDRAVVSRILSGWTEEGIAMRNGRCCLFTDAVLGVLGTEDAP